MIFLSYCWKNQAAAHRIDALLRASGFEVWMDFRQLNPSKDIAEQLDLAISQCSKFLAVRPINHGVSPWMEAEFLMARRYCKPIFQFVIGLDEPTSLDHARLLFSGR
jgi:TIR domain